MNLPRLIECLEPEVIRSVRESLANPIVHKCVHLWNAGYGANSTRCCTATVSPTSRWPAGFRDDVLGDVRFQDRVVARVINAVRRTLFDAEIHRSVERDSKNASGWELTMKALPLAMRIEGAPLRRALDLLDQAIELSPTDGLPVALAALCRAQRGSHHLS